MKNFLEKKFRKKDQQAEEDKTERITGLGRRIREEIAKWNQMTALRFQTGGRHQTSPASLWVPLISTTDTGPKTTNTVDNGYKGDQLPCTDQHYR